MRREAHAHAGLHEEWNQKFPKPGVAAMSNGSGQLREITVAATKDTSGGGR